MATTPDTNTVRTHKSGKNPREIQSYRPIALLCTLSKVFEKIVNNRITTFATANRIIPDHQFGFRKGHAIEETIVNLKPWEECLIQATTEDKVRHPLKCILFIPNAAQLISELIGKRILAQNTIKKNQTWRILNRVNKNTNAMLVWPLDVKSAEGLKEHGNNIFFGFKRLQGRLKENVDKIDEELLKELNINSEGEETNLNDTIIQAPLM